ncbi:hypothetical protein NESM_000091600 [Novymonas esmeraldas]|uniref:Uncharacterized protein n=1 Tax=Novymonas esmeraldas TaxID=1808958 RepID=A0AAW0F504_9TRYP
MEPQTMLEEMPTTAVTEVHICCVEVAPESVGAASALVSSVVRQHQQQQQRGSCPTPSSLLQPGLKGVELLAPTTAKVKDVRALVEQRRRQGSSSGSGDGALLNLYGVASSFAARAGAPSRGSAGAVSAAYGAVGAEAADPLVLLPDEVTLEEVLRSAHVFALGPNASECEARVGGDLSTEATPTLLLFYSRDTRYGGCCCCAMLMGCIAGMLCCCCMEAESD